MIRHSTSILNQRVRYWRALLQYGRTDLAAGHVPFKQMLFIHWAPTPIDPQDSDVLYTILTGAVCYAAALGQLGHRTFTVVALARKKQFKSDYDPVQY
jgi:hypothetical protein